jgi:quercetin dioxygenase-like cupin family protein
MRSFVMMHRSLLLSLVLCLLPNLSLAQSPIGSVENRTGASVTLSSRFAATITTPTENGAAQSFDVSLGSLSLRGGRRIEAPSMGHYVATLVAGELITNIAGKETQRHPGDTWAVNAGEVMTVQLEGKSKQALLQIFTVKESSPPK